MKKAEDILRAMNHKLKAAKFMERFSKKYIRDSWKTIFIPGILDIQENSQFKFAGFDISMDQRENILYFITFKLCKERPPGKVSVGKIMEYIGGVFQDDSVQVEFLPTPGLTDIIKVKLIIG